jgi:hypothetical protein
MERAVADTLASSLDPLIFDLVEWCAREPRAYAEVLDVWRTSCPRLTVWEDATERGYLARPPGPKGPITVTPAGLAFLKTHSRL